MTEPHLRPSRTWRLAHGAALDLSRPRVMAILNVTPDSFSDGGQFLSLEAAVARAREAVAEGADMLDIGGESTRPGSRSVAASDQIARVVPVIRALRSQGGAGSTPISVDTTSAEVAAAALEAGANAVNDTSAGLDDPGMFETVRRYQAGLVLMHRLAPPERDSYSDRYQTPPTYADVVLEVGEFLGARAEAAAKGGIAPEAIILDPGLGFGKTVEQNLELIRRTSELRRLGYPILSGVSRKSFVGRASGLAESLPADRLPGTLALSVCHLLAGASLFRVHDVRDHAQALAAAAAAAPPVPRART